MMKHFMILTLLSGWSATFLHAQLSNESFTAGLTIGLTGNLSPFMKGSQVSGLPETIIPDIFVDDTYHTEEVHKTGFSCGIAVSRRFKNLDWMGFHGDLLFAQHYGGYDYDDILGLTYQMRFKYWYGSIMPSLQLYPGLLFSYGDEFWWTGFYARLGLFAGLNLTPEGAIRYRHQPEGEYGDYQAVQDELNHLITGRSDFGFMAGIGYEKEIGEWGGLFGEFRLHRGTSDVVKVAQNGYGFRTEVPNNIRTIQFSAGISFYLNQ